MLKIFFWLVGAYIYYFMCAVRMKLIAQLLDWLMQLLQLFD